MRAYNAESAHALAQKIADDFTAYLDAWHSAPEVFDDELDAQIHRWYADYLADRQRKIWPPMDIAYFSPSSANSCLRELYEKIRGAEKDKTAITPFQGRWTRIGTAIGDMIQRDILFAEKHGNMKRHDLPVFSFERNSRGEPMFEEFAKTLRVIDHNGKKFALYGTCDGIMRYVTDEGEVIRIGLEVKSKQTTAAQTSLYSMKEPKEDHVRQCVAYSLMYDVDYYVILYVNAAKKAWDMTEDDYEKNPDIRAFGIVVSNADRFALLDRLASVVEAAESGIPPKLDIEKWAFNKYKRACALSLSDDELAEIERKVALLKRSNLPEWKKRGSADALAEILRIKSEV